MDIIANKVNSDTFPYTSLDWEYAKKKSENPSITFEEVLKEKFDKQEEE